MGRIAFVFAGQGAQAPGMGNGFYNSSEAARSLFLAADGKRPGTVSQCFSGTEAELQETINTQPCLFTVEMAIAAALSEAGIEADITAGFSLGELSALTYAGVMDFETGLKAVMKRAELMSESSAAHDTAMAAVMKLDDNQISELCSRYEHIYPVNFNCPGQTSVSGDAGEMEDFAQAVKDAGGRARILKVSGAFHSPYMSAAAEGFQDYLGTVSFNKPKMPVYSNFTAQPYDGNLKDTLACQINNPVKWELLVRNMIEQGADTFIEVGPGKTLSGFVKRIDTGVKIFNVAEPEDLRKLKAELGAQ